MEMVLTVATYGSKRLDFFANDLHGQCPRNVAQNNLRQTGIRARANVEQVGIPVPIHDHAVLAKHSIDVDLPWDAAARTHCSRSIPDGKKLKQAIKPMTRRWRLA